MARSVKATIGELKVEQERMEAILRGMVEGVLVTDLNGRSCCSTPAPPAPRPSARVRTVAGGRSSS
jgi:hypothetical protein